MAARKAKKPGQGSKMTVDEAGRKGGQTVKEKYGSGFYSQIGQKGGQAVRDKYGSDFYSEIGQKGGEARKEDLGPAGYSELGRKGGEARGTERARKADTERSEAGEGGSKGPQASVETEEPMQDEGEEGSQEEGHRPMGAHLHEHGSQA